MEELLLNMLETLTDSLTGLMGCNTPTLHASFPPSLYPAQIILLVIL